MISPLSISSIPELPHFTSQHDINGMISKRYVFGLSATRHLFGGTSAWVTRHRIDTFQIVNLLGSSDEIESSLRVLLMQCAQKSLRETIQLARWNDHTFVCVGLSSKTEIDGCLYMLCVKFDCQFELSERMLGVFDGLRSSLQDQISYWTSWNLSTPMQTPVVQSVTCSCCCRLEILEHGRIFWAEFSSQKALSRPSLRICDECAFSLYSDAL